MLTVSDIIRDHGTYPSAGKDFYARVKSKRISQPEVNAYFQRWVKKEWPWYPISMDIENTAVCNYSCSMCPQSDWPEHRREGTPRAGMSYEVFKNIINDNPGLLEIKIQGIGEPTLQRSLCRCIIYARRKGIWVRTITNGSLLHLKRPDPQGNNPPSTIAEQLVASDVCEIQISIDGATKDIFEKIRIGGKFEQVCANAAMLNTLTRRTKMWTVVQDDNAHQLDKLVKLASILGFPQLTFGLDVGNWGIEERLKFKAENDVRNTLEPSYLLELIELGKDYGIDVTYYGITEKYDRLNPCRWPTDRMWVGAEGKSSWCCIISDPSIASYGEWGSEEHHKFMAQHASGQIPDLCKGCYKHRE